jgi:threonine dehydrogenase-like Zn-dependent dehydrogenase
VSRHFFDRTVRRRERQHPGRRSVAVFAQGPIGLCATLGAKLKGASVIIAIDSNPDRLEVARRFGATVTLNIKDGDPLPDIKRLTDGRGVDVAIEALGLQETFENALKVALHPHPAKADRMPTLVGARALDDQC